MRKRKKSLGHQPPKKYLPSNPNVSDDERENIKQRTLQRKKSTKKLQNKIAT